MHIYILLKLQDKLANTLIIIALLLFSNQHEITTAFNIFNFIKRLQYILNDKIIHMKNINKFIISPALEKNMKDDIRADTFIS